VNRTAALARHPIAIAGAVLATASAAVFIALLIAEQFGLFENPYAGLVVFIAVPAAFVVGLLLIPMGMWLERRRLTRDPAADADWPVLDFRIARVRRLSLVIVALTAVNVVILLVAGYGSLHWMDSPQFCGQVCHEPMQPQHTAWQAGPHARIACASCHIGEGARGFVAAKTAGTRQLVHVVTGAVPRPVPPGAHPFGGFNEVCARCHQAMKTPGDVIRVKREYAEDEANTETMTILLMHVGRANETGRAIHWHADPSTRVEFAASDHGRQTIGYVKVTDANGRVKEYFAPDAGDQPVNADQLRLMECVDCHNMVGHRIASSAEQAVDNALAGDDISRKLPFARREGVRLLKASYANSDEASRKIDEELRRFYSAHGNAVDAQALSRAVSALQGAYQRNVFPAMKVSFGTYPDNTGHVATPGCFRCHDGSHTAKDGSTINGDCEYCHRQVERPQAAGQ
jgi:hypothetical protein